MPWEAPLQSILQSIEGPVAKIIAVIIIIVTGLTLAFGDTGGGFRRLIQIVFGHRSPSRRRASSCRSSRSAAGRSSDGGPPEALDEVPGFSVPVHRALTEHILLGGAPRSIAILNGTLAGAVGLGLRLWLAGILIWASAISPPSGQQSAIRSLSRSAAGICAFPAISRSEAWP
jgi:hypothetical protein